MPVVFRGHGGNAVRFRLEAIEVALNAGREGSTTGRVAVVLGDGQIAVVGVVDNVLLRRRPLAGFVPDDVIRCNTLALAQSSQLLGKVAL